MGRADTRLAFFHFPVLALIYDELMRLILCFSIVAMALIAGCASREELDPDETTKDDILTAVFLDYIANMPAEPNAKGRRTFYVTAGREDISESVLRRLKRRWPNVISRDEFDRRYGNMDASWGYYGAEIKSYTQNRALVATWSSRTFETSRLYIMERRGEAWIVKSSEHQTVSLPVKPPRTSPTPSPTPARPFYP